MSSQPANDWKADDKLWSSTDYQQAPTDGGGNEVPNPWGAALSDSCTEQTTDTTLSTDDFSDFSVERCKSLCAAVEETDPSTNLDESTDSDNSKTGFETDENYLHKLERKLNRLYALSGRAAAKSMLRQVSDRANSLFIADAERQDTSSEQPIVHNPVTLRLFPQQALNSDEKVELVKCDHLANSLGETIDDSAAASSTSTNTTLASSVSANITSGSNTPDNDTVAQSTSAGASANSISAHDASANTMPADSTLGDRNS